MAVATEEVRAETDDAEPDDEGDDDDEGDAATGDDDDEEGEAEAEPEQPSGLAPIGPEEIRKAERARSDQQKRLARILGAEYVAHECLFCTGLGFTPELPPVGATFHIVQGADGPTFEVQGPTDDIPLLTAPDKTMCDECDGYGEVLTGSKAPHGMVAPCSKCAGNGWIMVARESPVVLDFSPALASPVAGVAVQGSNGAPDAWGRPAGHVHWGVPPASVPG